MPETADPLSRATDLCTKLRAFRKGTLPSSALAVRPRCVGVGVASHPAPAASPRSRAARPVPVPPRGVPGTVPPRREEREPAVPLSVGFRGTTTTASAKHGAACHRAHFPSPVLSHRRSRPPQRGSHTWSCARDAGKRASVDRIHGRVLGNGGSVHPVAP